MFRFISLAIFGFAILVSGCSPTQEVPTAAATRPAYPGPVTVTPIPGTVPFRIDRPVRVGDRSVKGSGPSGIPVIVVNVTLMGNIMGGATIGTDNRFEVAVPPLDANIRIGVGVGDLTGTGHVFDEFQGDAYKGEGAMLVPLVGYFQDTALVQP